jgi:hypothetical protein
MHRRLSETYTRQVYSNTLTFCTSLDCQLDLPEPVTLFVASSRMFVFVIPVYGWLSFVLDATSAPNVVAPARSCGMAFFRKPREK